MQVGEKNTEKKESTFMFGPLDRRGGRNGGKPEPKKKKGGPTPDGLCPLVNVGEHPGVQLVGHPHRT